TLFPYTTLFRSSKLSSILNLSVSIDLLRGRTRRYVPRRCLGKSSRRVNASNCEHRSWWSDIPFPTDGDSHESDWSGDFVSRGDCRFGRILDSILYSAK